MYRDYYYEDYYLSHHGIKGQQWGVRNGPPYPIEDKILRKGTKINSVSAQYIDSDKYKKSGKAMYTYRADEEWDNKVYKGPFSKYLSLYRGARWIKEHQYETVKDLIMPNKKERVQEFKDLFDDKKYSEIVKKDIENTRESLVKYNVGNEKEQKEYSEFNVNNIKTDNDWKVAYSIFNHTMESSHLYKSTSEYMNRMSKKYDAMVDDNNQGVYNNAHDPIIIFKAEKVIKDVSDPKSPHYVTADEILKNYEEVKNELAKEGKGVKL